MEIRRSWDDLRLTAEMEQGKYPNQKLYWRYTEGRRVREHLKSFSENYFTSDNSEQQSWCEQTLCSADTKKPSALWSTKSSG